MTVTFKTEKTKLKTYTVAGDTLADIYKDILKKGPKDPNDGKKVAALTTTKLFLQISDPKVRFAPDGATTTNKKGEAVVKALLKTMDAKMTSETLYPKLGAAKLSVRAKVEWLRFIGLLIVHEAGHIGDAEKECKAIIKEIDKMRGNGTGADEGAAAKNASMDLAAQIVKAFSVKKLDKRFNDRHKKFDKPKKKGKPGHGPVLDTSIV